MWNIFDRSVSLIKLVSDVVEKKRNSILKEYDMTDAQVQILVALGLSETGECSLKELEHFFLVAQPTMAGIVSRLEVKELVEPFTDTKDKRVKKIRLTQKGKKVIEQTQDIIGDAENWLTSELTEAEKKELIRLLLKVYNTIK